MESLPRVVTQPETDYAPVCNMAVKIKGLEGEAFKTMQQPCFLIKGDEIGLIAKTFGRFD